MKRKTRCNGYRSDPWFKKGYAAGKRGGSMNAAWETARRKAGASIARSATPIEDIWRMFHGGFQEGQSDASKKVGGRFSKNPGKGWEWSGQWTLRSGAAKSAAMWKQKGYTAKIEKRTGAQPGFVLWLKPKVKKNGGPKRAAKKRPAKKRAAAVKNPLAKFPIGKWFKTKVNGVVTKVRRTRSGYEVAAKK